LDATTGDAPVLGTGSESEPDDPASVTPDVEEDELVGDVLAGLVGAVAVDAVDEVLAGAVVVYRRMTSLGALPRTDRSPAPTPPPTASPAVPGATGPVLAMASVGDVMARINCPVECATSSSGEK
jgi:hypothetical protein